ncbi:MAG TPA: flagellar protein FlgN [Clostridia bacterium]|nr:flagellar protein FlgN [Clostridia bacterium]
MEATDYIKRMHEISLKKLTLVEEILTITQKQKEALGSGKLDAMDALIDERQLKMDAVDKIDEQFIVYASRLKSLLSLKSFEDLPKHHLPGTNELKDCVSKIHQRLEEIKSLEDENTALLKIELKDTQGKIDHSKTFKRVQGAYHPVSSNIPSYFFDKKK